MSNKKTFRNGNGVLDIARLADGPKAETLRGVISWNELKARAARKKGDKSAADRHDANRATAQLELVRLAQAQAA